MPSILSEKPHVGDKGTIIRVRAFEDDTDFALTNVVTLKLLVIKPGASTPVEWTSIIDPNDNKWAKYVVVDGDFSIVGMYTVHLFASWDDANEFTGKEFQFEVLE